jgi:hypothetical protein
MSWKTIAIWAAILLLLDAGFGLWNHDRFRKLAPGINVRKIAFIEAGIAALLATFYFLF